MKCIKINCRAIAFGASVLFVFAFILPLFFLDKTLIWDDWVWIHSSPEELRNVATQLGLWWLADLNVYIYNLKDPNLFLSLIAFCSHVISIAVLSRIFIKLNVLDDIECAFWAACCIVSPYLLIRYTNSVAFYNVWFACFVCAAYLFVFCENKLAKLLSAPLFLISFSLNSLIPAYFIIIIFSDRIFFYDFFKLLKKVTLKSTQSLRAVYGLAWLRLLKVWPFVSLPFVFYIIKFLSPYTQNSNNPYEFYNVPQLDSFFWSPLLTLKKTLQLSSQVTWYGLFGINSLGLFLGLAVAGAVLGMLFFLKKVFVFRAQSDGVAQSGAARWKNIILLFSFSCALVFPYVLVGKSPELGDFVEARHFLPAQPFIYAVAVLIISGAGYFVGKSMSEPRVVAIALLSVFASFGVWRAIYVASTIWWENKVSNYVIDVIKRHKSDLRFWVFDNQVPEPLGVKRWNYVYTGFLISAFGTKDNFGISKGEYLEWNQPVRLLGDPYFRRRYNIENYVHQDSYNYVAIKPLRQFSASETVFMYIVEMFGYGKFKMEKFVSINVLGKLGCVDEAVSLFMPDVLSGDQKSNSNGLYCKNIINKYCDSIKKGGQVIQLDQMEYAYAIQKYPSLLSADGLHVINESADFAQIAEKCSLAGKDFFLAPK